VTERNGIEFRGIGHTPGALYFHFFNLGIEQVAEFIHFGVRLIRHWHDITCVCMPGAVWCDVDVFTFAVAFESIQSKIFYQVDETSLVRGDPLTPDFDEVLVAVYVLDSPVPGSATDTVASFND